MLKPASNKDLKVGDIIYISQRRVDAWEFLGRTYKKTQIKRITPKGTKIITDDGKDIAHVEVFTELDNEMIEQDKRTRNLIKGIDFRYKLSKADFKKLDDESLEKITERYQEILDICLEKQVI